MLVHTIVGYKSVGKGYQRKPQTLVPHGQWWFHSTVDS